MITYGKEEDELVEKYDFYAEKLQLLYPRTAAIVRRISNRYRTEAKEERTNELKEYY